MKRTELLTNIIFDMYLCQSETYKHAHENNGWSPVVFFKDDENHILTKRSIRVPKCFKNKDGNVPLSKLHKRLWISIYKDIKYGLGYCCGINIYGDFEVFYKKSMNVTYSQDALKKLLGSI